MAAFLLALCAGMALFSVAVVLRGVKQAKALEGNAYGNQRDAAVYRPEPETGELSVVDSESAAVANGLFLARQASFMDDSPARTAILDHVIAMVEPLRKRKAYWADASTTLAYAYGLKNVRDPRFAAMLAQSYEDAPYLRSSAYWRLHAGLTIWDRLDPRAQQRVVDEAVWFTRVNTGSVAVVLPMFRGTPAYERFVLARLAARVGDPDFSPIKGLSQQKPGQ